MTNRRQPSQSNGFRFLCAERFRFFASVDFMRSQYSGGRLSQKSFSKGAFFIFLDLASISGE
jgi:hypothetical protein